MADESRFDDTQEADGLAQAGALGLDAPRRARVLEGVERAGALDDLLPSRYADLGRIGLGGMGEVRRIRDRHLHCTLAIKIIRPEFAQDQVATGRFLEEAYVTAQLPHPCVVSVHDHGRLSDGRAWFSMKEVRGRTLDLPIAELHQAALPDRFVTTPSGWTLHRLVDAFVKISEAVGYAHSRGIVHRDLKPLNVMVGEFGEVYVMDWGLARRLDGAEDPVDSPQRDNGALEQTQWGKALGTPGYLSPEQARGERDRVGPTSDVYSLGAILHELLVGRSPHAGRGFQAVLLHPQARLVDAVRSSSPALPDELVSLVDDCIQLDPRRRPVDGAAVARRAKRWLDGEERRELAFRFVVDADGLSPEIQRLQARSTELETRAARWLAELPEGATSERRAPGRKLQEEAAQARQGALALEVEGVRLLESALRFAPDLMPARERLAAWYLRRLEAAEAAGDPGAIVEAESRLRLQQVPAYEAMLSGLGTLSVTTDVVGTEVALFRFEERERQLLPEFVKVLGRTPLAAEAIPLGSYLLKLFGPGRLPVDVPVMLRRGRPVSVGAPERPLRLPRSGELEPDDVLVAGGPCLIGGDPEAVDPLPASQIDVPSFVMRRHPVTFGEWVEYLNDLINQGRPKDALRDAPVYVDRDDAPPGSMILSRDGRGYFEAGEGRWSAQHPVVRVSWHAARRYAAWFAERTGKPWRLPHELEREKAGRGVDGRPFPWGRWMHSGWSNVVTGRLGPQETCPVGLPIEDVSVYGICGLAGNSRDWCGHPFTKGTPPGLSEGRLTPDVPMEDDLPPETWMAVRGASSASPVTHARLACRFGGLAASGWATVGVRLVYSWADLRR
jgi:serine/threonine-protein kinase